MNARVSLLGAVGFASLLVLPCRPVLGQVVIPPRDWKKNPVVVEVTTTETVYAVGDAHGDPERLFAILAGAGLVDPKQGDPQSADPADVKWTGGKSLLVIPGDMIDKGSRSLDVITLLRSLQQQTASDQGSQVLISLGNHEGEFLADPKGKKTAEFQAELTKAEMDPGDVAAGKTELGQFLCGLPFAVRVNDWFFCHAGNTKNRSVTQLSADIMKDYQSHGFNGPEVVGPDSILEARLHPEDGMNAWIFNDKAFKDPKSLLQAYTKALGVNHLVQGHQYDAVDFQDGTVRPEGAIFQRYGLLFLIDGAMSHGIKKKDRTLGGALRIDSPQSSLQKVTVICPAGAQTLLWSSDGQQDSAQQLCDK